MRNLHKSIVVLALVWWVVGGRRRVLDDLHFIAHLLLVTVAVLLVRDRLDGLADVAVT